MILPGCFLCQRPVLGLEGQSQKFDPYYLSSADAAYQAGAFGYCHTTCLLASPWGSFWSRRMVEHRTTIMRQPVVGEADGLVALRHENTKETFVFRDDGLMAAFKDADLKKLTPVEHGFLQSIDEPEYNLDLTNHGQLAETIKAELLAKRSYPLMQLIEALGITDTVFYPAALRDGALLYARKLKRDWKPGWLAVQMRYQCFHPAAVVALARRAAQTAPEQTAR